MNLPMVQEADPQSVVRAKMIAQFASMLPLAAAVAAAVAALNVLLLADRLDRRGLAIWLPLLAATTLWRMGLWWRFRALAPDDHRAILALQSRLRLDCLLGGCVWASACVLLDPGNDLVLQTLLVLMLVGVSAGAVNSMASDRIGALLFQAPIALAVAVRAALGSDAVQESIFGMTVLYALFIVLAVIRQNHLDREKTVLRLEAARHEHDLRESELRFRRLANTDPLTGLPNRASLAPQLRDLLQQARDHKTRLALLYVDVDNFKDINDSHGHGFGDRFLTECSRRLRANVRPEDLVVRMGGDEFVVVARNPTHSVDIEKMAERLLSSLAQPVESEEASVHSGVSIGIAVFPDNGATMEELMVNADIALYQAKARGRGQYALYSPSMGANFNERRNLEVSLRAALGTNQLFVEYQPLMHIDGRFPVALEALVRWRHPESGLLPPGVFVPVAERCGLEDQLGEHVLRQVCRQLRQWLDDCVPVVPVAINVSPRQFERGHLIALVQRVTRESGIDPALITVELTESALMQHAYHNLKTLNQLRDLGVRVAIDDFGTGYSSLAYLKNLPIDSIKIDRSFVADLTRDNRDSNIIRAIVAIGESLAIRVVAEGVESEDQALTLRGLGCTIAQGYLFHRPMSGAACTALLQAMPARSGTSDTVPSRRIEAPDVSLTG